MLLWYYIGETGALQGYKNYKGVTGVLMGCYRAVTGSYTCVTGVNEKICVLVHAYAHI